MHISPHTICPYLLSRRVLVLVVGCGGNGSAIAGGLPYLHQAMVAGGHPEGLAVTLMDSETISPTNCVRQPFSASEIGLFKSVVLANRINLFWGLKWKASTHSFTADSRIHFDADIVISCVDTRSARAELARSLTRPSNQTAYWLDLGNNASSGQFVLGQPLNAVNRRKRLRLRTVAELYPEIVDERLDDDGAPSCSAIEALDRQEPFLNPTLANSALALLAQLFRYGSISHHAGFLNLKTGGMSAMWVEQSGRIPRRGSSP